MAGFTWGLFALCGSIALGAAFCGERDGAKKGAPARPEDGADGIVTVTGRARLVGNMPFPETVVSDDAGGDWFVSGPGSEEIGRRAGERVTVRGRARTVELRLADGASAGTRLLLEDAALAE